MADQHCIAIVDDDESVREAATNLFRSMGFNAVAFPSAEAFLNSTSRLIRSGVSFAISVPTFCRSVFLAAGEGAAAGTAALSDADTDDVFASACD